MGDRERAAEQAVEIVRAREILSIAEKLREFAHEPNEIQSDGAWELGWDSAVESCVEFVLKRLQPQEAPDDR